MVQPWAPSRLAGRRSEVATLCAAFDAAVDGRGARGTWSTGPATGSGRRASHLIGGSPAGQRRCVLVAGGAGVGKSALVDALLPVVDAARGWFVTGTFDPSRAQAGVAGLIAALRRLGAMLLAEPEPELVALRTRIRQALGGNLELVSSVLPEFAALLGTEQLGTGAPTGRGAEPAQRSRLWAAIVDLLRCVASPQRPVVLVLDDLQWAPASVMRFIDAVVTDEWMRGLLLVGTFREEDLLGSHPLTIARAGWARMGMAPEVLRLGPLSTATRQATDEQLATRLAQLPQASRAVLDALCCLDGAIPLYTLARSVAVGPDQLGDALLPALADGLLLTERTADGRAETVRFRGERVRQVACAALEPGHRRRLRRTMARRLAAAQAPPPEAAQLYLSIVDDLYGSTVDDSTVYGLPDPAERRLAVLLLHRAALDTWQVAEHQIAERYLSAGIGLLESVATGMDAAALIVLAAARHEVLCGLGRFAEADAVYEALAPRCADPMELAGPATVQITSLANRGACVQAVALGVTLLRALGQRVPEGGGYDAEVRRRLPELYRWVDTLDEARDIAAPEPADRRVHVVARLVQAMLAPAFVTDPAVHAWGMLENQRLWARYGACAPLVGTLGTLVLVTAAWDERYRPGYAIARHVLRVGEGRGYEVDTGVARFVYAGMAGHWFEPLENLIAPAHLAREGMVRMGHPEAACIMSYRLVAALVDCAPNLGLPVEEVDSALAHAVHLDSHRGIAHLLGYRDLLRELRGEANRRDLPAERPDQDPAAAAEAEVGRGNLHVNRALAAAVFGDQRALDQHAGLAMERSGTFNGFYISALARVLRCLALAGRVREGALAGVPLAPIERDSALAELSALRDWLAARAADAPDNFGHLLCLVDAERAWAIGEPLVALRAFAAGLREVAGRKRAWHAALLSERAALCQLAQGHVEAGRALLAEAHRRYRSWGAWAKVRQLEERHGFLCVPG